MPDEKQETRRKPPYPETMLTQGSIWYHFGTKENYVVDGVATCSTNGDREGIERSVIYQSVSRRERRYREVSEFLDGRFMPVLT